MFLAFIAPLNLPDLSDELNHPSSAFVFPKREFGKVQIVKQTQPAKNYR